MIKGCMAITTMETLHVRISPSMKATAALVKTCTNNDARSPTRHRTTLASVDSLAQTAALVFSSSSNHPISKIGEEAHNSYAHEDDAVKEAALLQSHKRLHTPARLSSILVHSFESAATAIFLE